MRWALLLLALLAVPAAATAGERVYRLDMLASSAAIVADTRQWILPELARAGFSDGRDLILDVRVGNPAELPELARKLVADKPDAILTLGGEALLAAHAATGTVPIVSFGPDPVSLGLAASFAHPGSNITGFVLLATELDGKRLDLLHAAVPAAHRIAALFAASAPQRKTGEQEMRMVAERDGLDLLVFDPAGSDHAAAFTAMRASRAQALVVTGNPYLHRHATTIARLALAAGLPTEIAGPIDAARQAGAEGLNVLASLLFYSSHKLIIEVAAKNRLPAIYQWPEEAAEGGFAAYGPPHDAIVRQHARMVAAVLRGAKPAELPVERPSKFELVMNLKTAKALGLTLPQSLLVRADEVIR